jgi:5-methylcytosine-specific restriction endonuclease McrA
MGRLKALPPRIGASAPRLASASTTRFGDKARGSRHERGYGSEWDKARERVMRRDHGLCQPSLRHGLVVAAKAVDHIVPRARGGTDADANLQAISDEPHKAKTAAESRGLVWDEAAWFAQRG